MLKKLFPIVAFFTAVMLVSSPIASSPGQKLCVVKKYMVSGLEVKKKPSTESQTIMIIGSGRVILEFGREKDWIYGGVERAGGITGYIPQEAVSTDDLDGMPCGT